MADLLLEKKLLEKELSNIREQIRDEQEKFHRTGQRTKNYAHLLAQRRELTQKLSQNEITRLTDRPNWQIDRELFVRRERFAIAALPALIEQDWASGAADRRGLALSIAASAYLIADAMIDEGDKE